MATPGGDQAVGPPRSPSALRIIGTFVLLITGIALAVAYAGRAAPDDQVAGDVPAEHLPVRTDAEVLSAFEQLDKLRVEALENRDLQLLDQVFTTQSRARRRVERTIERLISNDVLVDERRRVLEVKVLSSSDKRASVRQIFVFNPSFISSTGENVTEGGGSERQTVVWTMLLEDGVWRIDDAKIVDASPI